MKRVDETASPQAGLPIITIRGHHLINLMGYLVGIPTPEEYFRQSINLSYLPVYGEDFFINKLRVFEDVVAGSAVVRVSGSLDDLCEPCLNKLPSCSKFLYNDFMIAKMLGFNLQDYPSAEFADKLINGKRVEYPLFLDAFNGPITSIFFRVSSSLDFLESPRAVIAHRKIRNEQHRNRRQLTEEMKEAYFKQMMAGYDALKRQQKGA